MKKLLLMTLTILLCAFEIAFAACIVELTWDASPESDLAGYRVFAHIEDGLYNYNDPIWEGTETTANISDLSLEHTYYFVVRAFDAEQLESRDSNEVSFYASTPPCGGEAPVGLIITGLDFEINVLDFEIFVDGQKLVSNRPLINPEEVIERALGGVSEGIGKSGTHTFQLFDGSTEVYSTQYSLIDDTNFLRICSYLIEKEYIRNNFIITVFARSYSYDESGNLTVVEFENLDFWSVEISSNGTDWSPFLYGTTGHMVKTPYTIDGALYQPGHYYLRYFAQDKAKNKAITFAEINIKQPALPIISNIRILEP